VQAIYERRVCPHCQSTYRGKRIVKMEKADFNLWNELYDKQTRRLKAIGSWYLGISAVVAVFVAFFYVACIFTVKMPAWFFVNDRETMSLFSFGEVLGLYLISFVIAVLPFVIYVFLTNLFFRKCLDPWLDERFPLFELEKERLALLEKYDAENDSNNVKVVAQ